MYKVDKVMTIEKRKNNKLKQALKSTAGMWKDRRDIKDTAKWVSQLRSKMSRREHE